MINVAIIEESFEIREGLKYLLHLEPNIRVTQVCESPEEFLRGNFTLKYAHIILMDTDLLRIDSIQAIRLIKARYPYTDILLLTQSEDQETIFKAIKAGISGYILQKSVPKNLIFQIESVAKGGSPISPEVARTLLDQFRQNQKWQRPLDRYNLTPREIEILKCIVEGLTYKEIGEQLKIAPSTAKKHILHIYKKLEVNSKVEIIKKIFDEKLLDNI